MALHLLRSGRAVALTAGAVLVLAGRAEAETLRGAAELQYLRLDRADLADPQESWVKTLRFDYGRRLPGAVELSSHFQFSEQTTERRPDRVRSPQVQLQLAHPYFGLIGTWRPTEVRDAFDVTTRQQEVSLSGYLHKSSLPQVAGTWVRRHVDPLPGSPGGASVTRTVTGLYNLGVTSFRAGYGDQFRDATLPGGRRVGEDHYNLGATTQLHARRAGMTLQYDFTQSRSNPSGGASQTSRLHTAGANGSAQLTKNTSSSLTYSFRRTESAGTGRPVLDEHDGALTVSHRPNQAVDLSAGAGVRTARLNGQPTTERYLVASASAQGEARPGWMLRTAASHSTNWLTGQGARPVDSFRSGTTMRLTRGLDLNGDLSLSGTRGVTPSGAARGPTELTLQTSAGIVTNPLRTVFLDATVQRYRTGASLVRGGALTTAYVTNLRLRPSTKVQWFGSWGLTDAFGSRNTSLTGSVQWSPSAALQASGSYSRTRPQRVAPAAPPLAGQESYSGSIVVALARDLRGTVRYSESKPGQAPRVRQLNAVLTQTFGR